MSKLIVVVPSIRNDLNNWRDLIDKLKREETLKDAQWMEWPHHRSWFSFTTPDHVADELNAAICQSWAANGPFDELILVGHSFGGLVVRETYLRGSGVDPDFPQRSEWAAAVKRIILFSAINRGVKPEDFFEVRMFSWAARVFPPFRKVLAWHILRGSDFVTNLRIRWMRHFAALAEPPVIVQLRGTDDKVVRRDDSYDMEQFPTAYYISVPGAKHKNLFRLDTAPDPAGRFALLRDSFVHDQPRDGENIKVEGSKQVVLVVHGIRADNRTWVQQTEDLIHKKWPEVRPIGLRYELVTAAQFAFPPTRRRRLKILRTLTRPRWQRIRRPSSISLDIAMVLFCWERV